MDEWDDLSRAIGEMAGGSAEVREDGEWLAELSALRCEFRRQGKQSLVHLWSDERNLTRRIVRVKERTDERIVLEVQRFGRTKTGRLEFRRTDSPRSAGRISREEFRSRFRRILQERFPDAEIDSLTASPDLEHSFSGLYVRGRMHEAARAWALLAVSPFENQAVIEGMLTFGILWLDWVRGHAGNRAVEGLRLFVPEGGSRALRERVLALSPSARTEIYELAGADARLEKMDPADAGNLDSSLVPRREIESALRAAGGALERIRSVAEQAGDLVHTINTRVVPASGGGAVSGVAFEFRGLDFAHWTGGELLFGSGDSWQRLSQASAADLQELLRELDLHRSSLAEDTNHPMYRAAPERWLEKLVLEDPSRLDAQLDPRHLYSQVPALAAGDRGVLDLLGVTRRGRLVIVELKASEDIQLPFQAVDYWLRVRRHQREADFWRHGYFTGVELDPAPPLVWLVAPGFRFHPAAEIVLKYLSSEIHITRIGLNENWRRGIRVVFRQ